MRLISFHRARVAALLAVGASLGLPVSAAPQSMDGTGAVATGLLLRQMDGVKRVLMIAAHPDDEDTSLLTTLARERGVETAYLALTRGDGGQNLIGPELWEGLGVVRTGELMAARKLDGGEQFFTRAFDYGFSKTADEALSLWPREDLLEDVVWVVRRFRPHVIVTVFTGTPRDGHGQHQAAGIMAREAFAAAGDPSRFPEQLSLGVEAWEPAKLYQSSRSFGGRGGGPDPAALVVPTGDLDPLLGRSAFQLSMESRSQHRSQDMGAAQPAGPRSTGVILVESRVDGGDAGIFAGIDTTLAGLTGSLPAPNAETTRGHLSAYRSALQRARSGFGLDPAVTTTALGEALDHLEQASLSSGALADTELTDALAAKLEIATQAFMAAAGISLDVRTDDDLVVPGQTVRVRAQLWNASPFSLSGAAVDLGLPEGWRVPLPTAEGISADGTVAPGTLATWTFDVRLPDDAELSELYFLKEARDGARYRWPDEPELWGLPRDPHAVTATASFVPGPRTTRIYSSVPWRYVGVDQARGEFENRVLIVPGVSVEVSPAVLVWPDRQLDARTVSVVLRNEIEGGSEGVVSMSATAGWTVTPASLAFALPEAGTERTVAFEIRPNGSPIPGEHVFSVEARTQDGGVYSEGYSLIDYDHIERAALFASAEARATVVPVAVPEGLRVGYIMGSGDDGPAAIRQLGVDVSLLSGDQVREGAFDGFNTIVLGIRAYEVRDDLRAASEQLLDFVRDGGTVVAQYNRASLGSLPPFLLTVGRGSPRVTDETAAVRLVDPNAPLFTTPNRIGDSDFDGWVQERGLYFGSQWDDAWVPLLELSDVGEDPQRGSLLVASVGEGIFMYTGLSFFRQWADGVPGAYRLFANLISADPAAWSAYAAGLGVRFDDRP
jgi:LmbE family N-acetylglucosaminyl deacetylase